MDLVVLHPSARQRVVLHGHDAVVKRRFEKLRDGVGGGGGTPRARPWLRGEHLRKAIEELPHPGGEHLLEARECERQVAREWCSRDGFQHVAAQIQRAEFRQREAGLDALEHLAVEPPVRASLVVALVVEREARFLQRREVAANRPRRHVEIVSERIDRRAMAGRLERVEDLPLADDLLIARHSAIVSYPSIVAKTVAPEFPKLSLPPSPPYPPMEA